jgi:hypothetical protein
MTDHLITSRRNFLVRATAYTVAGLFLCLWTYRNTSFPIFGLLAAVPPDAGRATSRARLAVNEWSSPMPSRQHPGWGGLDGIHRPQ